MKRVKIKYEAVVEIDVDGPDPKELIARRMANSLRVLPGELDEKHVKVVTQKPVDHSLMFI